MSEPLIDMLATDLQDRAAWDLFPAEDGKISPVTLCPPAGLVS